MIEKHSAYGTYNIYGYMSNKIRYDSYNPILTGVSSRALVQHCVSRKKQGGIIVFEPDAKYAIKAVTLKEWVDFKLNCMTHDGLYHWSLGNFMEGNYTVGKFEFNVCSLSLEIVGLNEEEMKQFTQHTLNYFKLHVCLLKVYNSANFYIINDKEKEEKNKNTVDYDY